LCARAARPASASASAMRVGGRAWGKKSEPSPLSISPRGHAKHTQQGRRLQSAGRHPLGSPSLACGAGSLDLVPFRLSPSSPPARTNSKPSVTMRKNAKTAARNRAGVSRMDKPPPPPPPPPDMIYGAGLVKEKGMWEPDLPGRERPLFNRLSFLSLSHCFPPPRPPLLPSLNLPPTPSTMKTTLAALALAAAVAGAQVHTGIGEQESGTHAEAGDTPPPPPQRHTHTPVPPACTSTLRLGLWWRWA